MIFRQIQYFQVVPDSTPFRLAVTPLALDEFNGLRKDFYKNMLPPAVLIV